MLIWFYTLLFVLPGIDKSFKSKRWEIEHLATSIDYVEYVCSQIDRDYSIRYRKMFGEYMVYVNDKPLLLVCDNTAYVKILPCLDGLMDAAEKGHHLRVRRFHVA